MIFPLKLNSEVKISLIHFILLISTILAFALDNREPFGLPFTIYFLMIIYGIYTFIKVTNKITKSSNSLKIKIVSCLLLSFILFPLIIFLFAFAPYSIIFNEYAEGLMVLGLTFIPLLVLFFIVSFVYGLVSCIKNREKNNYPLNLLSFIRGSSIFLILFFIIFFLKVLNS